jgi:hypothetical protein
MHQASAGVGASSLYGFNLLELVDGFEQHRHSAYALATFGVCHGGRYPVADAVDALGEYDRAAFDVLAQYTELSALPAVPEGSDDTNWLQLSISTLGRLHIRPVSQPLPVYSEDDCWAVLGAVELTDAQFEEVATRLEKMRDHETGAMDAVLQSARRLHENGELAQVLEQVIDHVEHVESVCFYVGDRFYALIDRYVNLVDTKGSKGFLTALRAKPFAHWTDDEILIVISLHGLFTAGNSVKFEEFNGCTLSAGALAARLSTILDQYRAAQCEVLDVEGDIIDHALEIRRLSLIGVGKPYLRYRWIYGLTFQKKERILYPASSCEAADIHEAEFDEQFQRLVPQGAGRQVPEHLFFTQLAAACLARDLEGIACTEGSDATTGWIEYLIEKIVASAVIATAADYGMSSSLRDMSRLMEYDTEALRTAIHALTPADFFTCFVSRDLDGKHERKHADLIASSVQKRMMFNRWHFIPGNLGREFVDPARHWYYPPLVPDLAVHSDMHRAAHARAQVKYSIRAPGPDMSRPQLRIAGQGYRGFYDVRVVRMDGEHPFTTEDMMRARRRTLWMESVFAVLVSYMHSSSADGFRVQGFEAGRYLDISRSKCQNELVQQAAAYA